MHAAIGVGREMRMIIAQKAAPLKGRASHMAGLPEELRLFSVFVAPAADELAQEGVRRDKRGVDVCKKLDVRADAPQLV